MAQWTLAAGFADACIEKAAAKSASAGKNEIRVNQRNPRLNIIEFSVFSVPSVANFFLFFVDYCLIIC
jgi:hypothetical protein